jgi:hypothetical protein
MKQFQLIYMSSLNTADSRVVSDIVATAAKNNSLAGVTGMMLHSDGDIVQVLEGTERAVKDTFRRIQIDTRHTGIQILLTQTVNRREFGEWSMGYKRLKGNEFNMLPATASVFAAHDENITSRVLPGSALSVLRTFAQYARP